MSNKGVEVLFKRLASRKKYFLSFFGIFLVNCAIFALGSKHLFIVFFSPHLFLMG